MQKPLGLPGDTLQKTIKKKEEISQQQEGGGEREKRRPKESWGARIALVLLTIFF